MMSDSFMIRSSSPSSLTSVPDHLPNSTRSPALTSIGISLPALVAAAGADGDDFALARLFLGGVGDDDAALGLLFGFDAAHDHAVMQGTKLGLGHGLPRRRWSRGLLNKNVRFLKPLSTLIGECQQLPGKYCLGGGVSSCEAGCSPADARRVNAPRPVRRPAAKPALARSADAPQSRLASPPGARMSPQSSRSADHLDPDRAALALAGCAHRVLQPRSSRRAGGAGCPTLAAGVSAAGHCRALGPCRLSQGRGPPAHEPAAAQQCKQPYVITLGPTGGVMMHLADQATPTELRAQGRARRQDLYRAEGRPAGRRPQDREVVSFDGRVLILRWMDPEVQGRYGTMVYVRCGAEGAKRRGQAESRSRSRSRTEAAACSRRRRRRSRNSSRRTVGSDDVTCDRLMTVADARSSSRMPANDCMRHSATSSTAPGAPCRCSASRRSSPGARSSIRRC